MRWIKHLSAAGRDEKLMRVKDEFGMEGYGVYWSVLETISEQMTPKNNQCFLELSVKNWRKVTEFSPKKLHFYFTFLEKLELFYVTFNQKSIRVECPNLLKYRDEYQSRAVKKSGVSRDKVGSSTESPLYSVSASYQEEEYNSIGDNPFT